MVYKDKLRVHQSQPECRPSKSKEKAQREIENIVFYFINVVLNQAIHLSLVLELFSNSASLYLFFLSISFYKAIARFMLNSDATVTTCLLNSRSNTKAP